MRGGASVEGEAMRHMRLGKLGLMLVAVAGVLVCQRGASAQGVIAPFSGPVHSSMGWASTAAPLDALGANYWHPAQIRGRSREAGAIGNQLAYPEMYTSSAFLGAGGTTRSDSGLIMIPGVALVYHPEQLSRLTIGMASYGLGAGVNYRGDPGNPIFSPTGPFGNVV